MSRGMYEGSAPYYDLIYEGVVDYGRECDLLEAIFQRHARREIRRVLDLGSGTGNHALVLSDRGYDVVGLEPNAAMLERARAKAGRSPRSARFERGDMRRLEVEEPFDALISMFGAFSHVPRDEASATLEGFARATRPGGLLVFEFWNPAGARDGHRDWLEREQGDLTLLRLSHSRVADEGKGIEMWSKYYVFRRRRAVDAFEEHARMALYPEEDMGSLLSDAGWDPVGMLDWTAKSLEPAQGRPFRILAVARRQG